jgi:hypothetical protein
MGMGIVAVLGALIAAGHRMDKPVTTTTIALGVFFALVAFSLWLLVAYTGYRLGLHLMMPTHVASGAR